MTTNWISWLSASQTRLEDRVRQLEIRQSLMARDLREMKRQPSGVDWRAVQDSWLVRFLLLLALLAFNWKLPDALALLSGK